MYYTRLALMQKNLLHAAIKKWNLELTSTHTRVIDVKSGTQCVCIGVLFKEMTKKPNFLHDYLQEINNVGVDEDEEGDRRSLNAFVDVSDRLALEDESGRMTLEGCIDPAQVVTGVIVAVYGTSERGSNFVVRDVCVAGMPPQNIDPVISHRDPVYVALVAGLNIGGDNNEAVIEALHRLAGVLVANHHIARLVIAGNSLCSTGDIRSKNRIHLSAFAPTNVAIGNLTTKLDEHLSALCEHCPVDVMPGDTDPTNCFMPQQPMHRCLLPRSVASLVPNPYQVRLNDVLLLGSSGQPVNDVLNYSQFCTPIEVLERMLEWRNIAPTAPDTLSTYPFVESDPFTLKHCPHILFSGNHDQFETRLVRGDQGQRCRLICLPTFSVTPSVVLVDIHSPDLSTECTSLTLSG